MRAEPETKSVVHPLRRGARSALRALALAAPLALWGACGAVHRPDGGRGLLEVSREAPDFAAQDQAQRVRTLREFRGHAVVLFFYPRDGTPGCTREACAFRDAWARLERAGAQVLGVSSDDAASHARFAREHGLQFPLLADTTGQIARAYGVGSFLGLDARVTFVISPAGRVVRVFPNVDPAVHADEVLRAVEGLGAPPPQPVVALR